DESVKVHDHNLPSGLEELLHLSHDVHDRDVRLETAVRNPKLLVGRVAGLRISHPEVQVPYAVHQLVPNAFFLPNSLKNFELLPVL
ncbi:hypothetical protein AVEN_97727-1, partial [Araneus ventricosus]